MTPDRNFISLSARYRQDVELILAAGQVLFHDVVYGRGGGGDTLHDIPFPMFAKEVTVAGKQTCVGSRAAY